MNTNLALGIQPLRIPDPAAPMQKALSLNAMLGQNELQGLQIGQARQALGRQSKLDAIKSQSRDLVTLKDRLMQEGFTNEAIELDRHLREQQKSQMDTSKDQMGMMSTLAGSIIALPAEQRALAYPQMAAEWKRLGLPNAEKVPDQWSDEFLPHLQSIASRGLNAQQSMERADYADLGTPESMPTTMSDRVTQIDEGSGAMVRSMPVQTEIEGMPLGEGDSMRLPDENVTANRGITPDDYRREAQRLQNMGTKAANERAKTYLDEANRLDERIWKERDQSKPGSIPAGVTWDSSTNQYKMDGRVLTGAEVQAMDLKGRKASASSVMIGDSAMGLGKAAQTKVDDGLLDSTARISRLTRVQSMYKPEYQEIGSRLAATWTGLQSKFGVGVSPSDRKKLEEFTAYRRTALDNVNIGIKEATGATMGVEEAGRLMAAMPNPGTSWYDGDDPITFKSKLDDTIKTMKMAEARLVYIKRNGMSTNAEDMAKQVPLEKMPQIMNQRGSELEGLLKQRYPNLSADEIKQSVLRTLAQEFGLVAD